ncbi:hypothetical protein SAMN04488505_1021171 [Chitinophaga rupis]|uniref:Uncharacterized protein n=1 Tax=Chitinophaga rupis TaxID=573321 RepID=A0A1H7T8G3_9BACT|nr:hypothetical protein [Chitinophaga rupis]SEL81172.1 hypothetical protein SAMN04488505_1021171 [Chitinophaga rupis]
MRIITFQFLALAFIFSSCSPKEPGRKNETDPAIDSIQSKVDDSIVKEHSNSLGDNFDNSYHEKEIKCAKYPINDTLQVTFFEDTIQNISCALYLKSELDIVDLTRQPQNYPDVINYLNNQQAALLINGTNIRLNAKIADAKIMLPATLITFNSSDKNYLLIEMNLISSMGGDYWYNLLLELSADGKVAHQDGIETTGHLSYEELKTHIL